MPFEWFSSVWQHVIHDIASVSGVWPDMFLLSSCTDQAAGMVAETNKQQLILAGCTHATAR